MKKLLTVLLLLVHVNFTLFIAQVDEMDVFDHNGRQQEDVNSLFQYLSKAFANTHQEIPKDNDDDTARYFHLEKTGIFLFQPDVVVVQQNGEKVNGEEAFAFLTNGNLPSITKDVLSPPPEA
jgi:hypothetical protein